MTHACNVLSLIILYCTTSRKEKSHMLVEMPAVVARKISMHI